MSLNLLYLSSFLLSFSLADKEWFGYTLLPGKKICFDEMLPETVSYYFEANFTSDKVLVDILNPKGTSVLSDENQLVSFVTDDVITIKYPSTSYYSGVYKICFENSDVRIQLIKFEMRTGIDAKDYSTLISQKSLKEVDLEAKKIVDQTQ
jgi:hypothetical protein